MSVRRAVRIGNRPGLHGTRPAAAPDAGKDHY